MSEPEDQGIRCETVSPRDIRSYTHTVSLTLLPKCELDMDDISEHDKVDREKPRKPQPCTENYRHPRKARRREVTLSSKEYTN